MGWQIIRQTSTLWAIWNTVTDSFAYVDCTLWELFHAFKERGDRRTSQDLNEARIMVRKIKTGKEPYRHMTLTYEEATKLERSVHGDKEKSI